MRVHGVPAAAAAAALLVVCAAAGGSGASPAPGPPARPADPQALARALEAAWRAGDDAAYHALWQYGSAGDRAREEELLQLRRDAQEAVLEIQPLPAEGAEAFASTRTFLVNEPRARVAQSRLRLARGGEGWAVVGRETFSQIDGLVHLSLHPQGYRADGMRLELEDFTLFVDEGTLFTSPPEVGPTVLVFVGRVRVRFVPRPEMERQQVAQLTGRPELSAPVRSAFVRLHPADFHKFLKPARLEPDPHGAARLAEARRVFDAHASDAFLLDTRLPRSPWWLLPSLGDAMVAFRTARHGTLTYTLSQSEPEGISLFDRRRRRQISLYPREGRDTHYDEDAGRAFDVVAHDIDVRFEPDTFAVSGQTRLRIRLLSPAHTLSLRLAESLNVESIRSAQAGDHLFFRVRHQDAVMVSLGALAGSVGEIELVIRFAGFHRPAPVERELLQTSAPPFAEGPGPLDQSLLDEVLVYSNRTAWHPQGAPDDHALVTLRMDTPAGRTSLTGGRRVATLATDGRVRAEFRQDRPAKYVTAVVGRLQPGETAQVDGVRIESYAVPRARAAAAGLLRQSEDILRFFTGEFGPCPYPLLNLAVIESITPGGHSPPGMVVMSVRPPLFRRPLRDDPAAFWEIPGFFLAHELAHQWWGHGVAGRNYRERWISEAMAQYAAALWTRRVHGEERFRAVMDKMGRWALDRSGQGPIHLGHRLGHIKSDPQTFRAVVYDKGAYVLHMLRAIVGEDAFRRGLTRLQEEKRFGKAGTEDLRAVLEQESGRDLRAYFDAWVYGVRVPHLTVRRRTEPGAVLVNVTGEDLPGPLPLSIEVTHAGGREARTVTLAPGGGSFRFEVQGRVRRVVVNADRGLLARITNK